jgi:hypothetical protein
MIFESYICQDVFICDGPFGVLGDLECSQIFKKYYSYKYNN